MKRALIITAMVIVVAGLLVALYFLFFTPSAKLTVGNNSAFNDTGSGTVTPQGTPEAGTGTGQAGTLVAPSLVKITSGPVSAGEVAFDIAPVPISATTTNLSTSTTSKGKVLVAPTTYSPGDVEVQYIDRESGNVYAYRAVARTLTRISDKTLPGFRKPLGFLTDLWHLCDLLRKQTVSRRSTHTHSHLTAMVDILCNKILRK